MKTIRVLLAGLGLAATLGGLGGCVGPEPDAIVTVTCGRRVYDAAEGWRIDWIKPSLTIEVYGANYEEIEGWANYGNHRVCDFDVEYERVRTSSTAM